ncbi:hypothetical protein GGR54DRAFT_217069 [Hypoxylon sp. NC1633]|nr:hypothetical protein GGR54DRAFT_217069 [Hypoxylon sp. NC1633]
MRQLIYVFVHTLVLFVSIWHLEFPLCPLCLCQSSRTVSRASERRTTTGNAHILMLSLTCTGLQSMSSREILKFSLRRPELTANGLFKGAIA